MEQIKLLLESLDNIYGWKIVEEIRTAEEVFFIKKKLDMNRSKEVHIFKVTLYVKFEEEGEVYLGQATAELAPFMEEDEMISILNDTKSAASFIKNKFYELPNQDKGESEITKNQFSTGELYEWIPKLTRAIYKADIHEDGAINSLEIFLNKSEKHIISSEGIDVQFSSYKVVIDLVAEWNGGKEPVELSTMLELGDINLDILEKEVASLIEETKERAYAKKTPNLSSTSVILTGKAVKEFLEYYQFKANAKAKYEGLSDYKIGEDIQGEVVTGEKLNIKMLPTLKGSSQSAPYDNDGILLKPVDLIKDGVLKTMLGTQQFASYIGIEPTGKLSNMVVGLGTISIDEIKLDSYIELVSFSDFQMRPISGDLGGEIRLANYYDGKETIAVTGGSLSTNVKDVQGSMVFSSEYVQYNTYYGPKYILFKDMAIAGS